MANNLFAKKTFSLQIPNQGRATRPFLIGGSPSTGILGIDESVLRSISDRGISMVRRNHLPPYTWFLCVVVQVRLGSTGISRRRHLQSRAPDFVCLSASEYCLFPGEYWPEYCLFAGKYWTGYCILAGEYWTGYCRILSFCR